LSKKMGNIDFTFAPDKTSKRRQLLENYFTSNVLIGDSFICSSFLLCRQSYDGIFYEGQLHHVGNYYDVMVSSNPYRIMVVGQEYGHGPSQVTMDVRRRMIVEQTGLYKTFKDRNPHMRGTTSVLRLLFGIPLGSNHASEFIQVEQGTKVHIFDMFALVNYLLCSAVSEGEGRRGKSTETMRANCLKHFSVALDVLEPNVMIVQSKSYWDWVRKAFTQVTRITNELYLSEIHGEKVAIAVFSHPSTPDNQHNWGRDENTPYLKETVVPTVDLIRRELLGETSLPRIKGEDIMATYSDKTIQSQGKTLTYEAVHDQMKSNLLKGFPAEVRSRKPDFKIRGNRNAIYLDRMPGSHYEICFRRDYYEFALHFQSTAERSSERRQAFDPHLSNLSHRIGVTVKAGKLENKGWMRVWYQFSPEPLTPQKVQFYTDLFIKFVEATFPILKQVYE
jgi:hypothetical protein